jgi:hypothetical protein
MPICMDAGAGCQIAAINKPAAVTNDLGPTTIRYTATATGIFPGYYGRLEIPATRLTPINLVGTVYIKGLVANAFNHLGPANVIGYEVGGATARNYSMNFVRECSDAFYAGCSEFVG